MCQTGGSLTDAGMAMEDGRGQLADGTRYEKRTTEDFGADGYWLRTTVMRGVSAGGKVRQLHRAFVPAMLPVSLVSRSGS